MKNSNLLIKLLLAAVLLMPVSAGYAQKAANGQAEVSRERAVNIARSVVDGRVLSVQQRSGVWIVKILAGQGEVHIVSIDATTAEVLSTR
ncbi:MAG: hypothetical protein AMJ69_11970 [Gammaproteobacteria bacterium SG8_47]|nr:MAG: hypothetical protein AMJ69_11970 [Gammaproteobacteria bacterium SG8_47]